MTPSQPNHRKPPTGPPSSEFGAEPTDPGAIHHSSNPPYPPASGQAATFAPGFASPAGGGYPEKKQMSPWLAGGVGVLLGSLGTVTAFSVVELAGSAAAVNLIEDTVTACGDPRGITIVDEGKSLLFDGEGEEDFGGASISDLACVFAGVDLPEHVLDQMSRTTAFAGNQSATWGDFEAHWTYHPDRGLDGAIRVVE